MPKFLDVAEFCKDLKEVTSQKMMNKRKFHPEGLFSEVIFGPIKNYTCSCGIFHGIINEGSTCEVCGVDILNSSIRRRRYAKIKLPIPIVNPLFYDMLVELGGSLIRYNLDTLMTDDRSVLYINQDGEYIVTSYEQVPSGMETWDKLEAIERLVRGICLDLSEVDPDWKLMLENIDKLFLQDVIVLPPDLRPTSMGSDPSKLADKVNELYKTILAKKETMKATVLETNQDKSLFYSYFKLLQLSVRNLYDYLFSKLSKKTGLIRGNILGKRVDFSGRAVITPDPTLNLDDCFLPYLMVLELYKLQIAKRLVVLGKFKLLNKAIAFIDDCFKYKNPCLFEIASEIIKDEVCILNRQPSLHRLSMLAFNIRVTLDDVIKIHPMVCDPYNADFDGDQMAVYIPLTEESKNEVRNKLIASANLYSPSNRELTMLPTQDIILGIYALTSNLFEDLKTEVFDPKTQTLMSQSQKIFNDCLPEGYPAILDSLGEKGLVKVLSEIRDKYSKDIVVETLDKVKFIGFKYCTLFGTTLSLDSCQIPNINEIKNEVYSGETSEQLNKISSSNTTDLLKKHFKYSYLIDSGARGSWDQVRQIILSRGFISNFKGKIIETPIKNCLYSGLDEQEFFNSTYGCRKGLLDVALNTGSSGYLSRKLIFACCNLELSKDLDDCGTTDTIQVYVTDAKKAHMLIGKYYYNNNNSLECITKDNYKSFIRKTLNVRSPIYCKNPTICHKCYGDFYKTMNSKYVGVIAAQSLGECNTQLVLRTFHTSGVAITSGDNDDMTQKDIVNDLSAVSSLLHKFPKGTNINELVSNLFEIYNRSRRINHVHFECVAAQLMWKGYHKWRLLENRMDIKPEYNSVQTVPVYESWSLSLAFSNPKKSILRGILYSGEYDGIMDKLLIGKKLS